MKFLKGYKIQSVLAITAKLIEAVFELMMPLLMARIIDVGIRGNDMNTVLAMVAWLFVLTILGYLSSITCQYLASNISQKVGGKMRHALFSKVTTFSEAETNQYSSAVLTNRITTDVNLVQQMIAIVIRLGVRAPILMIGSLFALATISPRLSIALLYTFPIFLIVVLGFMWLSMKGHKKAAYHLDTLVNRFKESLSGTRIIRAFSKQEDDIEKFNTQNKLLSKKQQQVGWITTLSSPLTSFIMNLVLLLLVYLGALEINVGGMTQGQTVAVINYCTQLVMTLIVAMNLVMTISRGYTSYHRIDKILNLEISVEDKGTQKLSDIESVSLDHVSYRYPGEGRNVLKDINLTVQKGEVLGIIGLTGSGKSTLVKLLLRLMDVSDGQIYFNNHTINTFTLESIHNQIGYAPQQASFLRGSLEDNVLMNRQGDAEKALLIAQGDDILNKGLDSMVEEGGRNLSGGQRQRVSIARALAKKPSLLVFDDTFSALDYLTDKNVRHAIQENYSDVAQIIVSQRTTTVMDADQILVLDKGQILAQGTHEELLESNEIYRRIHEIQTESGEAYVA